MKSISSVFRHKMCVFDNYKRNTVSNLLHGWRTRTRMNFAKRLSSSTADDQPDKSNNFPQPEFDFHDLCNEKNVEEMKRTIELRKQIGDIDKVKHLYELFAESKWKDVTVKKQLIQEALKIPNRCHPRVLELEKDPFVVRFHGNKRRFDGFEPKEFDDLVEPRGLLRRSSIGAVVGSRSYYLVGDLALLQEALCQYTLGYLAKRKFQLVSVPDILWPDVVQACGMNLHGERTQLYGLKGESDGCAAFLSGTSEMALAALHINSVIPEAKLPLKLAAVSRCFRAETSRLKEERGIYRVHQFTKVEMFGVTSCETGRESDDMLEAFVSIQEELFSSLDLHYRLLDMPANELGPPAYRKFDVEAWMPGRGTYGEISSASNCTDYQSRRLNVRYETGRHAHTVNGTACAAPRMLIALVETHQRRDGSIHIPDVLRPYLQNRSALRPLSGVKLKIMRRADGSN